MSEQASNNHTSETKTRAPVQAPQPALGEATPEQVALEQACVQRALAQPAAARPADVLALQRMVGNRATAQLLGRYTSQPGMPSVQRKIKIGEKELTADEVKVLLNTLKAQIPDFDIAYLLALEWANSKTELWFKTQNDALNALNADVARLKPKFDILVKRKSSFASEKDARQLVISQWVNQHPSSPLQKFIPLICPFEELSNIEQLPKYGSYTKKGLAFKPTHIVLHRTAGAAKLPSIKAHYEIDEHGKIYAANPSNQRVNHLWGKNDAPKKDPSILNENSFGIEIVGKPYIVKKPPSSAKDGVGMDALRKELFEANLRLPPKFKGRLMAMTNQDLYGSLRDSGWMIYPDLTTSQKKATYDLTQHIQGRYKNRLALKTHEEADKKVIGEGESAKEFLTAMEEYNALLAELEKKAPGFWGQYTDVGRILLRDQAMMEMRRDVFFEEFYHILDLARVLKDFMNRHSEETFNNFRKRVKGDETGMAKLLVDLMKWYTGYAGDLSKPAH